MGKNKIHFDWSIGFWSGVAVISLINITLCLFHKNRLAFDFYILGVSIIVLIVFAIILVRRKRKEGGMDKKPNKDNTLID